jgi:23S rRNA (uracil1939-C5)-methyltransferase
MYLAKSAAHVYAIDADRQAILDGEASLQENQITNVELRTGRCERIIEKLARQGFKADAATLNPPRTGCPESLLRNLTKLGIGRLVYISCSPPTLARDTRLLAELGFTPMRWQPLDMFPQTYHLEVAVHFSLRGVGRRGSFEG